MLGVGHWWELNNDSKNGFSFGQSSVAVQKWPMTVVVVRYSSGGPAGCRPLSSRCLNRFPSIFQYNGDLKCWTHRPHCLLSTSMLLIDAEKLRLQCWPWNQTKKSKAIKDWYLTLRLLNYCWLTMKLNFTAVVQNSIWCVGRRAPYLSAWHLVNKTQSSESIIHSCPKNVSGEVFFW
jgi:hypothetical protein